MAATTRRSTRSPTPATGHEGAPSPRMGTAVVPGGLGVVVVVGGAGNLGMALVERLLVSRAATAIRVYDLAPYRGRTDPTVTAIQADITDVPTLRAAFAGADVVFHLASLVLLFPVVTELHQRVNVGGTLAVIEACRTEGVRRLIYTSSIDAVHPGYSHIGRFETLPYPTGWVDGYQQTKGQAEQAVLAANSPELTTTVLRPSHITGSGDVALLQGLTTRGPRAGVLISSIFAPRPPRHSVISKTNCAHAHVLAAQALHPTSPLAGRPYIVTDGDDTIVCTDYVLDMARARGWRGRVVWVPLELVMAVAWLCDLVVLVLYHLGLVRPQFLLLSRLAILSCGTDVVATDRTFAELTGYEPIQTFAEALEETRAWAVKHPF